MIVITETSGMYNSEYTDITYLHCDIKTDFFNFEMCLN